MGRIRRAPGPEALLGLLGERLGELDEGHLVSCLWQLGQFSSSISAEDLQENAAFDKLLLLLIQKAKQRCLSPASLGSVMLATAYLRGRHPQLKDLQFHCTVALGFAAADADGRDLSNGIWSLAKSGAGCTAVTSLHRISVAVAKKIEGFTCLDSQKLAWAYASLGLNDAGIFDALAEHLIIHRKELAPQGVANVAWAFARAAVRSPGLFEALATEALAKLRGFNAQEVTNLLWSAATLGLQQPELVAACAGAAAARLEVRSGSQHGDFTPQGLSNLAWALARLAADDDAVMSLIAERVTMAPQAFSAQHISMLAWAFSTDGTLGSELSDVLTKEAISKHRELLPQGLSNLAWAFANAKQVDEELFDLIAEQSIQDLEEFAPQELSSLVWAFATVRIKHPSVLRDIAKEAGREQRIAAFQPQELSNIAWGFASLEAEGQSLGQALATAALEKVALFKPQELSAMTWACAKLVVDSPELLRAVATAAASKIGDFSPQNICNLGWACAKLAHCEDLLLDTLTREAQRQMEAFKPQELCSLASSLARLRSPSAETPRAVAAAALAALGGFGPRELAGVAWSFATLGMHDRELFGAIGRCSAERLGDFKLQELSNLVWAFATLEVEAPDLYRAAAEELAVRLGGFSPVGMSQDLLAKFMLDLGGALWALRFAGALPADLEASARSAAAAVGGALDGAAGAPIGPVHVLGTSPPSAHPGDDVAPRVVMDLPDRMVLWKPSGWEVERSNDPEEGAGGSEDPRHPLLWRHLQALLPRRRAPLARDAARHHGLLHRLDVPSSGLLLAAKTHTAYHDLDLQLRCGALLRDYTVLCHGWPPASRQHLRAPVRWRPRAAAPSVVGAGGRPALTFLQLLGHAWRRGEAYALFVIRIATGRRHQIRVHTAHAGFPTVADFMYAAHAQFEADSLWCPRNFLHRHGLAFKDARGAPREALQPLPPELSAALRQLRLRRPLSPEARAAAGHAGLGGPAGGLAGPRAQG